MFFILLRQLGCPACSVGNVREKPLSCSYFCRRPSSFSAPSVELIAVEISLYTFSMLQGKVYFLLFSASRCLPKFFNHDPFPIFITKGVKCFNHGFHCYTFSDLFLSKDLGIRLGPPRWSPHSSISITPSESLL